MPKLDPHMAAAAPGWTDEAVEQQLAALRVEAGDACISASHIERYAQVRVLERACADPSAAHVVARLRAFFTPAAPTQWQAANSAVDRQAEELAGWATAHGVEHAGLVLARTSDVERGLVTTRPLVAGEAVISVPEQLVITCATLQEAQADERVAALLGAAFSDGTPLHEDVAVTLALLLQPLTAPAGGWSAYAPLLPQRLPNALHWSTAQLDRVRGTAIPPQTAAALGALQDLWRSLHPPLQAALPAVFGEAEGGWARLLWCYSLVETRGMALDLGAGRCTHLVPFADM